MAILCCDIKDEYSEMYYFLQRHDFLKCQSIWISCSINKDIKNPSHMKIKVNNVEIRDDVFTNWIIDRTKEKEVYEMDIYIEQNDILKVTIKSYGF